jgi:dihydroorotate dehydrogenase
MKEKKEEIISLLTEGLTSEEIPTITNLKEVEEIINRANFNSETSDKLKKRLKQLERETIWHANAFSKMIKIESKIK